jgi:hypothetical protein
MTSQMRREPTQRKRDSRATRTKSTPPADKLSYWSQHNRAPIAAPTAEDREMSLESLRQLLFRHSERVEEQKKKPTLPLSGVSRRHHRPCGGCSRENAISLLDKS